MTNIHDINKMTDEEKAALNKLAARNLVRFVATKVAITVAVQVAVAVAVKKLDAKNVVTSLTN